MVHLVNASMFITCANRASAYGAAWLAPSSLLGSAPNFNEKDALEYASFYLYSHAEAALKIEDDGWWLNHASGYEHGLKRMYKAKERGEKIGVMAHAAVSEACQLARNDSRQSSTIIDYARNTLGCIPYFGGLPGENELNTGSAHSRIDKTIKLRVLHAVICSMLQLARYTIIAVCNDKDEHDVKLLVNKMQLLFQHLPDATVIVHKLDCATAPGYLPFRLIVPIQRAIRRRKQAGLGSVSASPTQRTQFDKIIDAAGKFKFVLYNEADQIFHWKSNADRASAYAVLHDYPRAYVVPQRYEKRWGTPPSSLNFKHFNKAMNKCAVRPEFPLRTTYSGKIHLEDPPSIHDKYN